LYYLDANTGTMGSDRRTEDAESDGMGEENE